MTEVINETPETEPATNESNSKVKTLREDMSARRVFNTVDDATAYLEALQRDISDFGTAPIVTIGFTEDGEFDPEVYTEAMQIAVVKLSERGEGTGSSKVKMLVIYPSPRVDALMETQAGIDWVTSILQKELNHVAVRNLRKAESDDDLREALQKAPTTVADYITSQRESGGGILETYNSLWQTIKKLMGKRSKQFALQNLSKKELKKCMESASYASAVYPALESRLNKAGEPESYFQIAAGFGVMLAKKDGLDPAIFEKMLETRNEVQIGLVEEEEEDFDFDTMLSELDEDDND